MALVNSSQIMSQVTAKQMAFRGLAHFYQSLVCRANKMVGEEISRLQVTIVSDVLFRLRSLLKTFLIWPVRSQFSVEQLKGAASRVGQGAFMQEYASRAARHLAEASKDNDFIYHERVPDVKALEPLARAPVAKPLPPPDAWHPGGKGERRTLSHLYTRGHGERLYV